LSKGSNKYEGTSLRKIDHLRICLSKKVEGPLTTWLEYVTIPHCANPDIDLEDVDTSVEFLGKRLNAPLIVSAITGGAPGTERVNRVIAEVVEELGLGMGVGSQRSMLENSSITYTYSVVRDAAPSAVVIANIGAAQVVKLSKDELIKVINVIKADALAIHLNPAQEVFQFEGETSFKGLKARLKELVKELPVPIIIKEVGCGLSYEVVRELRELGIKYFDVAGAGGTNWILIELLRLKEKGEELRSEIASTFLDWCIPTAPSIIDTKLAAPDSVIIASGGLRTGVDVVKSIALGADLGAMALPVLKAAVKGKEALVNLLKAVIEEVRIATFLSGSSSIRELRRKNIIIYGPLLDWLTSRGVSIKEYIKIKGSILNI